MLDTQMVDFVVTVDSKTAGGNGDLFNSTIHTSSGSYLRNCSASAYFPVEFASVIAQIRETPGRFAITALPCFARGLRALAEQDSTIGDRLVMISGVICGGLKGRRYANYLSHQMDVPPPQLGRINFRGKSLSKSAHEKCVEVWTSTNHGETPDAVRRVQDLKGTDYGAGYFKPKACDYCDDVFAEVADVSFGDAWISPYRDNPDGTNVVVVRNKLIDRILLDAAALGEIMLDPLTPEQARQTQLSGLRHRRSGLAVRLMFARLTGRWTPRKRVKPAFGTPGFMFSQIVRLAIRKVSASTHLTPESPWFHRIMWRLNQLHGKVRPYAISPANDSIGRLRTDAISETGPL